MIIYWQMTSESGSRRWGWSGERRALLPGVCCPGSAARGLLPGVCCHVLPRPAALCGTVPAQQAPAALLGTESALIPRRALLSLLVDADRSLPQPICNPTNPPQAQAGGARAMRRAQGAGAAQQQPLPVGHRQRRLGQRDVPE